MPWRPDARSRPQAPVFPKENLLSNPSPLKLHVVICSTRPPRVGPAIAKWFHQVAAEHGQFDVELVDLAAFDLPVFDEPEHPRLQRYQHQHTKAWSAKVSEA